MLPEIKRIGILKFISICCLCCFLVVSCTKPANQPVSSTNSSGENGRITIGTTLKLRTIDPADAYEQISAELLYNLGDRLYTYKSGTTELVPQLATAMPKISGDSLTYTIPLRQGVIFHDGSAFNAKAMAFSLERFIKNGGRPAFLLGDAIASIKATGEFELTIKLKKPFAAFPSLLAFAGACAISPQAYEIGPGKFKPDSFVGTGPYKLVKYASDSLKFDVFDKYWGEKPANKGIDIQFLSTPANLFNAFKTGAVDVAYLSLDADQIRNLEERAKKGDWQAIAAKSSTVSYMILNLKSKPLDNLAVRQAIATIIDRPLLNERVLRGQAEPVYSLIPTTFDVYKPVFQKQYQEANMAKAKELLNKAGFSSANPAKLQIWYPSASTKRAMVANTLKAIAQKNLDGALEIEVNGVESPTLFQNLDKGIYPAALVDWVADYFDADNYIQPFLSCSKGSVKSGCIEGASQGQGSFYYSDRVNQLIAQQRQESNPATRKAIFGEIQDILAKDVPFIPLWQDKDYAFAQKDVTGVKLEPTQTFPFWLLSKQ
ncbi:peptide ABC transporter substrate-binding protein [Oscillatoriales cyanobacterium USR001]|nr:peptide ABC transporter substrate-binding protein [Oscillatoriales cyanobacterium USR001]